MHYLVGMCMAHSRHDLLDIHRRLRPIQNFLFIQYLFQGASLDVFHDHEEDLVLFFGRDHTDDIRVIQSCLKPRFFEQLKQLDRLLVRYLDGH